MGSRVLGKRLCDVMKTFSEFRIRGHVEGIRSVRDSVRISVVSDGRGNERFSNEIVISDAELAKKAVDELSRGDLVLATGTVREIEFEQFGEKIYASCLTVSKLEILEKSVLSKKVS